MIQLSLFPVISIVCKHCQKSIGVSQRNPFLMDGFWDGKYNYFVCKECKTTHYKLNPGYYTEMPFSVTQATLRMEGKRA
jgi:hypothetical protein